MLSLLQQNIINLLIDFNTGNAELEEILNKIYTWCQNAIFPIVGGILILVGLFKIITGIIKYVQNNTEGNAQEVEKSKKSIIWSCVFLILGIFVVSILPIVTAIFETLNP